MREILISISTVLIIGFSHFQNSSNKSDDAVLFQNSSTKKSKFNSGISIQDAGELIIIEQKFNDATIIIDKEDLDDILVFLNTKNDSNPILRKA